MSSKPTFHHGDLRGALVRAAIELLEESRRDRVGRSHGS
jgi:hypothetical protein